MTPALPESPRPAGYWACPMEWEVASVDDAVSTRSQARDAVAGREAHRDGDAFFAAASARVETAIGELLLNGLDHGGTPVRARLSRGIRGWLLVVSDAATGTPPVPADAGACFGSPGGLGLRLTRAVASRVGWYADGEGKHVWALVGDEPPAHLLRALAGQPV